MKRSIFVVAIAILLTGLAVALFIHANLGSDTITVFQDGLHRSLNVSLGNASRIYNLFFLVVALLIARNNIGWMTIVYAIFVGFAIDLFDNLLTPMQIENSAIMIRLLCIVLGQICYGITYSLLIKYRKGMNQLDAISYVLSDRIHVSYRITRTAMDVVLLVLGWIMGGVVGIGSVISMATTGLLVDWMLNVVVNRNEKNTKRVS